MLGMTNIDDAMTRRDNAARYGVSETGDFILDTYHSEVDYSRTYTLSELVAAGGKISRLRLLTERGYPAYDISYCHATLPNGQVVPVHVDCMRLPKPALKSGLIAWAKREKVFAKNLGLLDEDNWSILSS